MGILRSFSFVVLEFTEEWVKLAFFKSKGKLPRVSIGKKNIEKQKDEQVEKAVKDLFAEFRISRRLPVFVIIPRRLVTIRNLKLPSVSRDELSEMARLQAAKQLPYPPNELISDYRVIKKTPDGYSHLALAIAHRNVIERYLTILDNARVSPEQITVSSEALIEWFMATKAASKKSPGPTAIIDIDSSFAEVAITEGGGLQLSRSFSYHAPNNWKEKLQDEIKKTFFAYEKDTSRSISSAIVTGIEESGLWLNQALLKDFKIKDSEYVHPLRITSADYKQGLSRHMDETKGVSFAAALGVVFARDRVKLNFLPEELLRKKRNILIRHKIMQTGILLTCVALMLLAIGIRSFIAKDSQIRALDERIKAINPRVERLFRMKKIVDIVNGQLDMEGAPVDIMREVYSVIPSGVSLTLLDYDAPDALTLRGMADSLPVALKLVSSLEKTEYFKDVTMKYATKRIVKGAQIVDFELNIRLSKAKK